MKKHLLFLFAALLPLLASANPVEINDTLYNSTSGTTQPEATGDSIAEYYTITYLVDDEVYHQDSLECGDTIVVPEVPIKEGYIFSGWSEVPDTMPANDVIVTGTFIEEAIGDSIAEYYTITYLVDDEVYHQDSLECGDTIVVPEVPIKEGYIFSGWSEVPDTMPANDVIVTGTFIEEQPTFNFIASGLCGENLTWGLTEEFELMIKGTGAMYDYSSNNTPWYDHRKSIRTITIEEEVTSIGDYVFSNCTNFTSISIPDSVTSIGYRAFYRCSKLDTVNIAESSLLTDIGYAAFESCSKLTGITIPSGVISIGEYAFFSCKQLASITCYAVTPPTIGGASTFSSVNKNIPVYVLDYTAEAYQSTKFWNEFTSFIGMETGIAPSTITPQPSTIYDLHGRRITETEGLKGIYIIDGRKVIIR